ncbi:MAG: FtsX-like permease family protein [Actinobacteria bacterium]|nr:MAG: FtsX-like permease family protein [Actinomycetota bacterium]
MGVPIGIRQLFESRTRTIVSVGGVALAMLLVIALDGVFAGVMRQLTAYMDNEPFDVVMAQEGVRNLHMTSSQFPLEKIDEARGVDGVRSVDPILYTTTYLVSGEDRSLAYFIGYEPGRVGGPWAVEGVPRRPGRGEIVIDEQVAADHGLRIDDTITALGRDFRVAGLNSGSVSIINSIAFVRFDDFEQSTGLTDTTSFGLVRVEPGEDPGVVAARIRRREDGVNVMTREQFAENERRIISDMSVDIMRIMNTIAFLIGLAAVALTVYTATFAKLREYGVLKAVGARNRVLVGFVFSQAAAAVALGLLLAVALAFALAGALFVAGLRIQLVITADSVARVGLASVVIGLLGSIIPIATIASVKPADVLRR